MKTIFKNTGFKKINKKSFEKTGLKAKSAEMKKHKSTGFENKINE